MSDNDAGNDTVERALNLLVYGPVGLACYIKDSAPTFMGLFVSRGKREVDGARRTIEEKIGLGTPAPAPTPQQRVADGIGSLSKVAAQATAMVASMAGPVVNAATGVVSSTPAPAPAPADTIDTADTAGTVDSAGDAADLPIPGYDGLSATQVIERLDGMSRGALKKVRRYELAHRARRTILAAVDQRTN